MSACQQAKTSGLVATALACKDMTRRRAKYAGWLCVNFCEQNVPAKLPLALAESKNVVRAVTRRRGTPSTTSCSSGYSYW